MNHGSQFRAGDRLPELVRTIELPDMVAYAGATWDWHRLHYDPEYLASRRIAAPVVDGQVFGALLVEQLQDSLGPRAFVRRLEFRFKNLVFAGETVSCVSTVSEVHEIDDSIVLSFDCEVVVVGDNARVAVGPASAVVVFLP